MVVGAIFVDIFTASQVDFWGLMSAYKWGSVEILYIPHLEPISLFLALPRYNWGPISGRANPNLWLSLRGTGGNEPRAVLNEPCPNLSLFAGLPSLPISGVSLTGTLVRPITSATDFLRPAVLCRTLEQ